MSAPSAASAATTAPAPTITAPITPKPYRPTPLERAYASHLLATYFETPIYPTTNTLHHDTIELLIRVPGRNAVPFLTTSGVDRSLLRLIWQVSDPDGVGTLTTRAQFYVLLRLVAMAQAHFLPPLPSVGQPGGMADEDKLSLLKQTLNTTAHLIVALPTFAADSNCPSVAYLLGTYPPPPSIKDAVVYAADAAAAATHVEVSNMLTDRELQYQQWQQQQQQQQMVGGIGGGDGSNQSGAAAAMLSVSDAFGSMGEVEDLPLPSLTLPDPSSSMPEVSEDANATGPLVHDGGDDFGNFDSGVPPVQPIPQPTVEVEAMGPIQFGQPQETFNHGTMVADARDGDDFGNFDSSIVPVETTMANNAASSQFGEPHQTAPIIGDGSQQRHQPTAENNTVNQSNNFGDFDSIPVETSSNEVAVAPVGYLGNGTDGIISQEQQNMTTTTNVVDEDDFGGFATSIPVPRQNDAVEFADLSSVPAVAGDGIMTNMNMAMEDIKTESSAEDIMDGADDSFGAFGDFEAAGNDDVGAVGEQLTPAIHEGVPGGAAGGEMAQGGTTAVTSTTANVGDGSSSNALFGTFAELPPPLEEVTRDDSHPPAVTDTEQGDDDDNNGNFGNFEGTGEMEMNANNHEVVADAGFGNFGSGSSAADDAFGNNVAGIASFEPVSNGNETGDIIPSHKLSVFDALVEIQDAPLPSLSSFYAVDNDVAKSEEVDEAEDDEFGDFEGEDTFGEDVIAEDEVADDDDAGFGDFGSGQSEDDDDAIGNVEMASEHLPSDTQGAPAGNEIATSQDAEAAEDVGFGDFDEPEPDPVENGDSSNEETTPVDENNSADVETPGDEDENDVVEPEISDLSAVAENAETTDTNAAIDHRLSVFDDLIEIQDAPLPPLVSLSGGGINEMETQDAPLPPLGSFYNGSNAISQPGAAAEVENESYKTYADDLLMGEFEGSGAKEEVGTVEVANDAVISDAVNNNTDDSGTSDNADVNDKQASVFDLFGEVQDAPLPTLGSFASLGETSTTSNIMEVNQVVADDGFGDFEDTVQRDGDASTEALPSMGETSTANYIAGAEEVIADDGFGDFEGTAQKEGEATTQAPHNSFNAFSSSNAPMPPMPSFESFTAPGEMAVGADEVKEHGFGGFEGTGEPLADAHLDSNGHDTSDHGASEGDVDFFGDFSGNNDTVKPEDTGTNDDQFGAFGDNTQNGAPFGNDHANTTDNLTTFDALTEIPPPPFPTEQEGEDNIFGDFGGHSEALQSNYVEDENVGQFEAFPGAEANQSTQNNDGDENLGDFDAPPPAADEDTPNGRDDEFGQFGELPAADNEDVQKNEDADNSGQFEAFPATQVNEGVPNDDGDDNFGHFETLPSTADERMQKNGEDDNFGQFDAFPDGAIQDEDSGQLEAETDVGKTPDNNSFANVEDESFGQFETVPAVTDESTQNNVEDESFGQFEAFPAAATANEDESFGQFEAVPAGKTPDNNSLANDENEGFGQFETVPAATNESTQNNVEDESFGQFEEFSAAATADEDESFGQFEAVPAAANDDESFGHFEAHANADETPSNDVSQLAENIAPAGSHDDDFGTFNEVNTVQNTDSVDNDGVVESNDDFGDGFGDFSAFDDAQPESDKKDNLEEILCRIVGDEFVNLPGVYSLIIGAVENDLRRGIKIADGLDKKLSSKDRTIVVKSRKLCDHICGLAEYVRIVRSIAATIGELLGVNKNIDVKESTLIEWNDNAIIAEVIVVDYLWSEIISKAVALGIVSQAPKLESIVEIRARALSFDACQKHEFCQLTLQPLEEGTGTRSPVVWNGKNYMACAANFCANRMPDHSF